VAVQCHDHTRRGPLDGGARAAEGGLMMESELWQNYEVSGAKKGGWGSRHMSRERAPLAMSPCQ